MNGGLYRSVASRCTGCRLLLEVSFAREGLPPSLGIVNPKSNHLPVDKPEYQPVATRGVNVDDLISGNDSVVSSSEVPTGQAQLDFGQRRSRPK